MDGKANNMKDVRFGPIAFPILMWPPPPLAPKSGVDRLSMDNGQVIRATTHRHGSTHNDQSGGEEAQG